MLEAKGATGILSPSLSLSVSLALALYYGSKPKDDNCTETLPDGVPTSYEVGLAGTSRRRRGAERRAICKSRPRAPLRTRAAPPPARQGRPSGWKRLHQTELHVLVHHLKERPQDVFALC